MVKIASLRKVKIAHPYLSILLHVSALDKTISVYILNFQRQRLVNGLFTKFVFFVKGILNNIKKLSLGNYAVIVLSRDRATEGNLRRK